jgi:hypothetical protein
VPAATVRSFGTPGIHTFFGYYDLCPLDRHEARLLALQVPLGGAKTATVGYFDLRRDDADFVPLATTAAWCWQQGCRLRWMPNERDLIFANSRIGDRYVGSIIDSGDGREVHRVSRPLYDIASHGRLGLSLDFARLQRLRPGYGYASARTDVLQAAPDGDGVWLVDIHNDTARLLISLRQAAVLEPQPSMQEAIHYFNHLSWNPSGTRFMVFHIWSAPGQPRRIRMLSCDADGDVRLITNDRHVSHYWWLDDERLLVYGTPRDGRPGYYVYRDDETLTPCEDWRAVLPETDGHPSASADGRWIVTDTLPDRFSERSLVVLDRAAGKPATVARFYSPPAYRGETRCDLHPRWSPSGSRIVFDTAHAGYRRIAVLEHHLH